MEAKNDSLKSSPKQGSNFYDRLPTSLTTVTTFSKLIALFLFILLPFAGFMIGSRYQQKLDSAKYSQETTVETTPAPTTQPIDTSTWKTINRSLYEIKLPYINSSDSNNNTETYAYGNFIKKDPNHWLLVIAHPRQNQLPYKLTDWNIFGGNFIEQLNQIPVGVTSRMYDPKDKTYYSFTHLPGIKIAGEDSAIYDSNYLMRNGKKSRYAIFQHNDLVYVVTFEWTNPNDEALFETILSTFKFNDSSGYLTDQDKNSIKNLVSQRDNVPLDKLVLTFDEESKFGANYASGKVGVKDTAGGGLWFATKNSGSWIVVWTGNGLPSCAELAKYNLPEGFFSSCY